MEAVSDVTVQIEREEVETPACSRTLAQNKQSRNPEALGGGTPCPPRPPTPHVLSGDFGVYELGCVLGGREPLSGINHGYFIIALLKRTLGTEIFQCVL